MSPAPSLFIATPISAFSSNDEYMGFRPWVSDLVKKIKTNSSVRHVFCVAFTIEDQLSLDEPKKSLLDDIKQLDDADHFLLIYPKPVATSALIELGYVLAREKKITIVHTRTTTLPFMASQLDQVFDNVCKITINNFDDKAIEEISTFFSKI